MSSSHSIPTYVMTDGDNNVYTQVGKVSHLSRLQCDLAGRLSLLLLLLLVVMMMIIIIMYNCLKKEAMPVIERITLMSREDITCRKETTSFN